MIRTNALRIGRATLFMLGYKNCPGINTLFVFIGSNTELWKSLSAKIQFDRLLKKIFLLILDKTS